VNDDHSTKYYAKQRPIASNHRYHSEFGPDKAKEDCVGGDHAPAGAGTGGQCGDASEGADACADGTSGIGK